MKYRDLFSKHGLSLNRLHTLVLVAEAGSIVAAAPDDRNRQSLFSRQLNELEGFFPVALKQAHGRNIQLTPAGCELAAAARRILDELAAFHRASIGLPHNIALGAEDSILQWLVLPQLPRLRLATPGDVWHLHNAQNADIVRELVEESLDFGLLCSDLVGPRLRSQVLSRSFGYSLFVPRGLCPSPDALTLSQSFGTLPIAIQDDDKVLQNTLDGLMRENRPSLHVRLFCDTLSQVVQAVAGSSYAGVLPDHLSRLPMLAGVHAIPITEDPAALRRTLALVWNPQRLLKMPHLEKAREVLHSYLDSACRPKAAEPNVETGRRSPGESTLALAILSSREKAGC